MVYVSTWPNAKIIGKKSLYKGDSKSIELQELNTEKKSEVAIVVPQTEENTAAAPQTVKEPANVPQTEENTANVPQTVKEPAAVPQTEENTANVPQTEENTANVPQTEENTANVPQTEENTPQLASSQEGQPTTTISVSVEVHNTENQ